MDGVSVEEGDCDDSSASVYPGAAEVTDDGTDNDCEEDAPTIEGVEVDGTEMISTATDKNVQVGDLLSLEVSGSDDETLTGDLTVSWVVTNTTTEVSDTLSGATASFIPDEVGVYSIAVSVEDENGQTAETEVAFTANLGSGSVEGTELEEGDIVYEDPSNPETSGYYEYRSGTPYVDSEGNIVYDSAGDSIDVAFMETTIESIDSAITAYTYNDYQGGAGLGIGGFAPPSEGSEEDCWDPENGYFLNTFHISKSLYLSTYIGNTALQILLRLF